MSINQNGAITLDRKEWERIKHCANSGLDASPHTDTKSRLAKSQNRVKSWGNTLAASRQQKLAHRKRKEEEAERRRCLLDQQEERIRNSQRQQAIARATKMIYNEQDQIKRMRSKQILSDALAIQAQQRQQKAKEIERNKQREAYFHTKVLEQIQTSADREAAEAAELAKKRAEVSQIQAQQLEYHTKRHIQKLVEEREEGAIMTKQAQRAIEEEQRKIATRAALLKSNNREMAEANEKLKVLKQKEMLKVEEEQRKIAQYAADRDKRKAKREAHMRYKHDLKQKSIQKMINKAVSHLEALKSDEDFRLARDVKLADEALARREQAKLDHRQQEMQACHESRQQQLRRKQILKDEEAEADRTMVAEWMSHNQRLALKEQQKIQQKRQQKQKLARGLQQKEREIRAKLLEEREMERQSEQKIFADSDKNALQFEQFLHAEVDRYAKAGKNTKALTSALKGGPDLLPAM